MPAEDSASIPDDAMRCAVLGSPIAHSLSPTLHRAAYRELGLDWVYTAHDVSAEQLPAFVAALTPQWRGLSLTMPLKQAVVGLCDRVESRGALLQSINTVVIGPDGRSGYNTDVVGLVNAFGAAGVPRLESALVVGAGATAASALAAVADLGAAEATVLARTPSRADWLSGLGTQLGLEVRIHGLTNAGVHQASHGPLSAVVSTIPAAGQSAVAAELARAAPVVFDVIYEPRETPLLLAALAAGTTTIGGFELLLHQAARQVELMTGADHAPLEAMRIAGARVLDMR